METKSYKLRDSRGVWTTTGKYWSCDCDGDDNFIHLASEAVCPRCDCEREEMSHCLVIDIIERGMPL